MTRWQEFVHYLYRESTLPPRDREITILRVAWLRQAEYAWSRHTIVGKRIGLTDHEIHLITLKSPSNEWNPLEATLLQAIDELHNDSFISDMTWKELEKHYSTHQLMDFILFVGVYSMISMMINSLGVQLDDDATGFPPSV